MNQQHKYRIGTQLILSWVRYEKLKLGELISNAIEDKDLSSLEDQELIDLIEKYCGK